MEQPTGLALNETRPARCAAHPVARSAGWPSQQPAGERAGVLSPVDYQSPGHQHVGNPLRILVRLDEGGVPRLTTHGWEQQTGTSLWDAVADPIVAEQVEIATKYEGYIDRQQDEITRHLAQEEQRLPAGIDYRSVRGLSVEVQQKLNAMEREQPRPGGNVFYHALPGMPGAMATMPLPPDPGIAELRKQIEQLRHEVQELREQVGRVKK